MAKKTPPSKAYPAWTEARLRAFITSGIRSVQRRWPPMQLAKNEGRIKKEVNGKMLFFYQCACCEKWFRDKDIQMDHKVPCGSWKTFDELGAWVERLFCHKDGWQRLCKPCHQIKTNQEREARK